MEPNLFRNRWLALAFVGLVLIGAVSLVGSESEDGLLDRFMRAGNREPAVVEKLVQPLEPPSSELLFTSSEGAATPVMVGEFAPEEELIDDTEGFDTIPMIVHDRPDHEGAMLEAEGETLIIAPDEQGSEF